MVDIWGTIAGLRQPEYTGENRCLPCTVLNALIVGCTAAVIGAIASPIVGVAALGAGLLVVYLRGYLIPGTPRLTAAYVPDVVLRPFGKEFSQSTATGGEGSADRPPADGGLERLERTGILVGPVDGESVHLSPGVRDAWHERIDAHEGGPSAEAVADALGAAEATRMGDASFVLDGERRVSWESRAALIADLAAAAELRTRLPEWPRLESSTRITLLTAVRGFLQHCPECGGEVTAYRDRIAHCCRPSRTVIRATCRDCSTPLLDRPVPDERIAPPPIDDDTS